MLVFGIVKVPVKVEQHYVVADPGGYVEEEAEHVQHHDVRVDVLHVILYNDATDLQRAVGHGYERHALENTHNNRRDYELFEVVLGLFSGLFVVPVGVKLHNNCQRAIS